MPEVVSDIIVTAAKVFNSPVATALPAATVAAGGSWPAGWVSVGYTTEAVKATYSYDKLDIKVQQELGPLNRIRIAEDVMLETVLAEFSAAALALAFAGTATSTAAASGVPGYEEFDIGGAYNLPVSQWGLEGSYVDEDGVEFPIRLFIYKATSESGGDVSFDRENIAGIPLKISALPDTTKVKGKRLLKVMKVLEPAL